MFWPLTTCCGARRKPEGEREPLLPEDALPQPVQHEPLAGSMPTRDEIQERQKHEALRRAQDDKLRRIVDQATEQIVSLNAPTPFLHVYASLADAASSSTLNGSVHSMKTVTQPSSRSRHNQDEQEEQPEDQFQTARTFTQDSYLADSRESRSKTRRKQIPEAWRPSDSLHDLGQPSFRTSPDLDNIQVMPTDSHDLLPVSEQENDMVGSSSVTGLELLC